MKFRLAALSATIVLALAAGAARAQTAPVPQTAEAPLTALPYSPSLDTSIMSRTVDPCVDFFQFSCGKWLEKNPIPSDRAKWNVYAKLSEDNLRFLWGLLKEAARPDPARDANTRKIGDYFAACTDEPALE